MSSTCLRPLFKRSCEEISLSDGILDACKFQRSHSPFLCPAKIHIHAGELLGPFCFEGRLDDECRFAFVQFSAKRSAVAAPEIMIQSLGNVAGLRAWLMRRKQCQLDSVVFLHLCRLSGHGKSRNLNNDIFVSQFLNPLFV